MIALNTYLVYARFNHVGLDHGYSVTDCLVDKIKSLVRLAEKVVVLREIVVRPQQRCWWVFVCFRDCTKPQSHISFYTPCAIHAKVFRFKTRVTSCPRRIHAFSIAIFRKHSPQPPSQQPSSCRLCRYCVMRLSRTLAYISNNHYYSLESRMCSMRHLYLTGFSWSSKSS